MVFTLLPWCDFKSRVFSRQVFLTSLLRRHNLERYWFCVPEMQISTDHSHNSNEDYQSKSSVDSMSMSCNVRMTILIEFYYPQTSDNVHEWRVWNGKTNLYLACNEGREGVKWELGFAFFGGWEMGLCALGLGFMKQKQ